MVPVSLGIKYRFADRFSVSAEYSYRRTNTDKLDGFFKLLSSDDSYSFFNIGVICHLGSNDKMIEWENPLNALYADLYTTKNRLDRSMRDSDSDGVPDLYDKEADTPEGTRVYGDGTSVDTDGDGIPDRRDEEPFSAKNAKVDASGREIVLKKAAEPVVQPSMPPAAVPDNTSAQPKTDPQAQPVPIEGNRFESIYFAFDDSKIDRKYFESLGKIAAAIKESPGKVYRVIGISDGSDKKYNYYLSVRRAEAVKRHLVKYYDINSARLVIEVDKPPSGDAPSNPLNRRVDVIAK
jgi:OOP family OmpA-OmpF porin